MGSFSMICSASGLGISAGTPVRCLLVTESPYKRDDPRNSWIVRTPPIRAEYNDYGSIENVHADDKEIADLWLRGLREDVVVKGMGDNSCHDVAVSKDMTFEEMLEAIWEQRLEVCQDTKNFWMRSGSDDSEYVSTSMMTRVSAALEKDTPGCVAKGGYGDKYVVDEPVPNMVRIRYGGFECPERRDRLGQARVVVAGIGCNSVVSAGTGSYPDAADLLVFPAPGGSRVMGPSWKPDSGERRLRVGLVMIREDVWQGMIQFPHQVYCSDQYPKELDFPHIFEKHEYGGYAWYGIDAAKQGVHKAWAAIEDRFNPTVEKELEPDPVIDSWMAKLEADFKAKDDALTPKERAARRVEAAANLSKWEEREAYKKANPYFGDFRLNYVLPVSTPFTRIFQDSVPGVIGISAHFSMLLADKKSAMGVLLDSTAELLMVQKTLGHLGVVLAPSESTGPQYPEWDQNLRFTALVAKIAAEQYMAEENDGSDVGVVCSMADVQDRLAVKPAKKVKKKVKKVKKIKKVKKK